MKTKDGLVIEMIEKIDDLGDGCGWGVWACNVEMPDGTVLEDCEIQGDGHGFARETLRDETGKEL